MSGNDKAPNGIDLFEVDMFSQMEAYDELPSEIRCMVGQLPGQIDTEKVLDIYLEKGAEFTALWLRGKYLEWVAASVTEYSDLSTT